MALSLHNSSTYDRYPYLSADEFAEVCHFLDRRYRQATLGPLRQHWRLDLHNALDTLPYATGDLLTFVQIVTPLRDSHVDSLLAARLDCVSLADSPAPDDTADTMMLAAEETDAHVVHQQTRTRSRLRSGYVLYEIHLHPTYRLPCLWFSLHNLPIEESPLDMDTVFRRVVPPHFTDSLRRQGPIGGVSIDHHPITGLPSFFIHPCLLGDAMAPFQCSKDDYLMVWIGLVGSCVGLSVPTELATSGPT
ncbi:hypothetical protein GGR57DRAFT_70000 [Xylariaceae sp. FL1272]|nr:hypothetical protein GGR57DRAFT_70000 [Xylariaceae sp. FL1272]